MRTTLTVFLAAALANAGCEASAEPSGTDARAPKVVVAHPERVDFEHELVLPGSLEGFERAELYAQVTGYLADVSVDIGHAVEAGDVVAKISVPEMRADFRRAQARLDVARAKVTRSQEEQQLAQLERERRSGLRAKERSAIAQTDVDVASASEDIAVADVARARAEADTARADIARLRTLKGFSEVRAPFSGRITRRILHPGALVREGTSSEAEPIVELTRVNPLRLVLHLPEAMVRNVAVDHPVSYTLDARPHERFDGKVARLSGKLDPQTRSMRAEVDVLNDDGRFAPGMYANVQIKAEAFEGALALPSAAVRGEGQQRWVLVVRDSVAHKQTVTVAFDDGKRALVSEGVSQSDAVVIAGSPLAADGKTVEAVEVSG